MKKMMKKFSSLILSMMLIVAMALCTTGCGDQNTQTESSQAQGSQSEDAKSEETVLGEGAVAFTFTVVDAEGKETVFEIHTDATTVGDALLEHNLIAGEDSEFGLYVKTVNGIAVDYDTDGCFWAFYVGDEMAPTGVDTTAIEAGVSYTFKVEK